MHVNREKQCAMCKNTKNLNMVIVKERLKNKGETFRYLQCSKCGTLQLIDQIQDMGMYYGNNYYAFGEDKRFYLKYLDYYILKLLYVFQIDVESIPQIEKFKDLQYLAPISLHWNFTILDVGCDCGNDLRALRSIGFSNLTGVDLFSSSPKDKAHIRFIEGDIFKLNDCKYDLILLSHSFEHMEAPQKVINKVSQLLSNHGICVIRIPVMEKYAWLKYGTDWYQIDALRHQFIYTEKSLSILCQNAGLKIFKTVYDSAETQFRISENYKGTKLSYPQIRKRKSTQIMQSNIENEHMLNKISEGDQAIFYIRKCRQL